MLHHWFWHCSEYASDFECVSVLNIPRFWICFWFWICQSSGYTTFLNMPELYRVLNMPEYAWLCLNRLKGFCFKFTYCNLVSKEIIDSFLLIFSTLTGSIWFYFCFRLNIFTSMISNLLSPLWVEGAGGREFWYTQPMIYPINTVYLWSFFNDLLIYFVVVVFPIFVASKDFIRDS